MTLGVMVDNGSMGLHVTSDHWGSACVHVFLSLCTIVVPQLGPGPGHGGTTTERGSVRAGPGAGPMAESGRGPP